MFCSQTVQEPVLSYTIRLTNGSIIRSTEVTVELTCQDIRVIEKSVQEYEDVAKKVREIKEMMLCANASE